MTNDRYLKHFAVAAVIVALTFSYVRIFRPFEGEANAEKERLQRFQQIQVDAANERQAFLALYPILCDVSIGELRGKVVGYPSVGKAQEMLGYDETKALLVLLADGKQIIVPESAAKKIQVPDVPVK